jgi:hypothetical protein
MNGGILVKPDEFVFQGRIIPDYMVGGITRYIEHGVLPGDFLRAVISNDLKEACSRADSNNMWVLPVYVAYFYNNAPGECWGSKEKMLAWQKKFKSTEESFRE